MYKDMKPGRFFGLPMTGRVDDKSLQKEKYSFEGWENNTRQKIQFCRDQAHLAELIINDSNRVIKEVNEGTKDWQYEVDYHLKSRADELRFLTDELNRQRKTAVAEEEAMSCYCNRITKAAEQIETGIRVNQECQRLRMNRNGIDLCTDDTDLQLIQELKTLKGCQDMIRKVQHDASEQLRRLRAAIYELDEDIGDKTRALLADRENLTLRENMPNVTKEGGAIELGSLKCDSNFDEWQRKTTKNIEHNAQELNTASELRCYMDLLLKQICEDLYNQTERTNNAFKRRIRETREYKRLMEEKHNECGDHCLTIQHNIERLKQEIADRERSLTLCKTRLRNRARASGSKGTCDPAQQALLNEHQQLTSNLCKLNQKLNESLAMVRYLTHTQIVQEEEMNMKANTLKIDEVECQTIREILIYKNF